jgi:pyrroloquinoline quinone biosynthesis protein E
MVRLRRDPRDGGTVLLSPERGLRLSETAAAVVALCDGARTEVQIVEQLAARYGADRGRIETDVASLLEDLRGRGLVVDVADSDLDLNLEAGRTGELEPESSRSPDLPVPNPDAPYTLVAELTHRCPLACPYCSNPRELVRGTDELSTEEWGRVIDEAAKLGVMQVHLSGGEPLARADLEAIAQRARDAGLYVNLVTSGIPLERRRFERLAPSLDHVQLSVQDSVADRSDAIAGMECHAAKLLAAEWVKDLGLPLTLNVVLHRANIDRLEEIVELAVRLRADRLELANVQFVSWALANEGALLPTRAQVERARVVAREAKARLVGKMAVVFVLPDWHAELPRACMDGWGTRFMVIAPDGALLPCHAARTLPISFDNVRSGSLAALWKEGAAMRAFRGEDWMREPCRSCDRRNVDHGGCRCQAFALTGDARAADPACALAPGHDIIVTARLRAERAGAPGRWLHRGRG